MSPPLKRYQFNPFLPADSEEGSWYPREKIRTARKKLQGYNPAHVMLVDLKNGHEKTREFDALKTILMGDKRYSKRAKVRGVCVLHG